MVPVEHDRPAISAKVSWLSAPLVTERLSLRPPRPEDDDAIRGFLLDPQIREFLGGPLTEEQVVRRPSDRNRWGAFVIAQLESGDVIGTVSFDRKRGPWEVSYQLRVDRWGQGLAIEAVRAAVQWFFSQREEAGIIAVTQTRNKRSRRLLEKLGGVVMREFEEYGALQTQYRLTRERL